MLQFSGYKSTVAGARTSNRKGGGRGEGGGEQTPWPPAFFVSPDYDFLSALLLTRLTPIIQTPFITDGSCDTDAETKMLVSLPLVSVLINPTTQLVELKKEIVRLTGGCSNNNCKRLVLLCLGLGCLSCTLKTYINNNCNNNNNNNNNNNI